MLSISEACQDTLVNAQRHKFNCNPCKSELTATFHAHALSYKACGRCHTSFLIRNFVQQRVSLIWASSKLFGGQTLTQPPMSLLHYIRAQRPNPKIMIHWISLWIFFPTNPSSVPMGPEAPAWNFALHATKVRPDVIDVRNLLACVVCYLLNSMIAWARKKQVS